MGLADRLRDAARPTNTITEAPQAAVERRDGVLALSMPQNAQTPPGGPPASKETGRKPPAYQGEPEGIAKAYYVEQAGLTRNYWDDYQRQNLAMQATDASISSKREDLRTVRAMVELAAARGWISVDVNGSKEFKREAWIEATTLGIEARGYKPNDPDRQEADRRRAERGLGNEVRGPAPASPATPAGPVTPNNPNPSSADPARQAATMRAGEPGSAEPQPHHHGHHGHGHEHGKPSVLDHRRVVAEARRELSPDGRTVLAAMSEKVDREMNRLNSEAKAEMKAHVAGELVKKERAEGPIVLSPEQRRASTAPEPAQAEPARAAPPPERRAEPDPPRRTIGR